jgi:protein tyrosine phosphatase (PTP) superfamily phosphohydrolase (DUF442 family)
MNFKSQNPIDVSQSQRFKLYKSGKLWLVAGLTFFSFLGGSVVSSTNVHADATPVANAKTTSDSSSAASSAATSAAASDATTKATNASSTTTTQATSAATTKTTDQASAASSSAATSSATSTAASSESSVKTATSASSTATSQATSTATIKASSAATSQATSTAATKASSTATSQATSVASSTATSVASSTAAVKAVAASSTVSSAATTTKKTTAKVAAVAYSAATTSTDIWTIGDTTRPRVDVVDVASYQSEMTQSDYNKLKAAGVKTVIVKSTQGDSYTNPAALNQAKMANKAGLNVDFYHYATFNTSTEAKSEATNMASFLVKNNVSTKVLLFADMEDSSTYTVNAEANLNAFWSTLNSYGYTNHGVYTSNTYLYRDAVIRTVGTSRVWRAQYPYTPSANNLWNTGDGAWQFSDTALLPSGSDYTGYIDVSIDYNGLTEDSAGTNTFVTTTASDDAVTSNTSTDTSSTTTNNNTSSSTSSNTSTSTSTSKTTVKKASGWYTFTKNTAIKSAASDSAKTVGTYSKGNRVYYNAKVTTNGETWLRYLSYSGAEHYVKISSAAKTTKPSTSSSSSKTVTKAETGTYKFTKTTAIKGSANDSAKTLGNYYKGDTVYYNAKVTKNGETWLRYLSYSGAQHYVKISSAAKATTTNKTTSSSSSKTVTKVESGAYKFTKPTAIKGSTSDSAKTLGNYYKGDTVYYNAKITKNGQTWLRYLSYSGTQHYVKISGAAATTTSTNKSTSTSAKTVAQSGTYKFTKTTTIKSSASDSASTVGTYYKGNTVNYNAKVTANGQTWLRYTSYSGAQHYVKISGGAATTTSAAKATSATGTYTFKTTTNIRTAPSLSASVVGQYYTGESVYYIGKVSADGYQWLKYVSNSGAYHYTAVVD